MAQMKIQLSLCWLSVTSVGYFMSRQFKFDIAINLINVDFSEQHEKFCTERINAQFLFSQFGFTVTYQFIREIIKEEVFKSLLIMNEIRMFSCYRVDQ